MKKPNRWLTVWYHCLDVTSCIQCWCEKIACFWNFRITMHFPACTATWPICAPWCLGLHWLALFFTAMHYSACTDIYGSALSCTVCSALSYTDLHWHSLFCEGIHCSTLTCIYLHCHSLPCNVMYCFCALACTVLHCHVTFSTVMHCSVQKKRHNFINHASNLLSGLAYFVKDY